MRSFLIGVCCVLLAGCTCYTCQDRKGEAYYVPELADNDYVPASRGQVFHVAGFNVKEGQQMRDFFDDFEEPMHAKYVDNNTVEWTYYVDYNRARDKGKIVRYCELDRYPPHGLCAMTVTFYLTYVTNATTNCY